MVKEYGRLILRVFGRRGLFFFYRLYWKDLLVHHNLEVMHIEKNVCESLIGTLLNIPRKPKDGENARLDMVAMRYENH